MGVRIGALIASLAIALVFAGVANAGNAGRPLSTPLTGAAEVPGPGDADAGGRADLRLNQGQNRVCFDLGWTDVDGTVVAAHVHVGAADEAGPVVVPLFSGAFAGTDATSGCIEDVDADLIKAIRQDPAAYYVNVHSTVFTPGAIRGQLSK